MKIVTVFILQQQECVLGCSCDSRVRTETDCVHGLRFRTVRTERNRSASVRTRGVSRQRG